MVDMSGDGSDDVAYPTDQYAGGLLPKTVQIGDTIYVQQRAEDEVTDSEQRLLQQLAEYQASVALWKERFDGAEGLHQEFRKEVRDKAIEVAAEMGWCPDGLNRTLHSLGLDPAQRRYRVTVRVFAYQDVEVEILAGSEEEAGLLSIGDDKIDDMWNKEDGIQSDSWDTDTMTVSNPEVREIVVLD